MRMGWLLTKALRQVENAVLPHLPDLTPLQAVVPGDLLDGHQVCPPFVRGRSVVRGDVLLRLANVEQVVGMLLVLHCLRVDGV